MRKAIKQSIPFAAWVLCVVFLAAAVDPAPDPPAVKPCGIDAKTRCLADLESSTVQNPACFADPRIEVRWTAVREVFKTKRPIELVTVVRQAADPSPPPFRA